MKLGYIDYLNCYPFYYHMFEKKPVDGVSIHAGYPSMLNEMLITNKLDMSPISSATCADVYDEVLVLPDFCLSSVGYVGSVILASKVGIEDLDKRKIGITSASHTSVVLLKTLMTNYYNSVPEYVTSGPMPSLDGLDASLLIGNEAMGYKAGPGIKVYDLGKLWLEKTGFPVVFAVFAVRENVVDKYREKIGSVIESYHNALECLKNEKSDLIAEAVRKYPDVEYDIDEYYNLLQFEFTDDLKEALNFYFKTAGDLELIRKVERLKYF